MALTNREVAVLGVLLCCVPFQLWLSQISTVTREERTIKLEETVINYKNLIQSWLSPSIWAIWLKDMQNYIFVKDYTRWYPDDSDDPNGECPAVEVIKAAEPNGYFTRSAYPRLRRPNNLKFRVGQVVHHKIYGYNGVIVGWDKVAKAPDHWLKEMHEEHEDWKKQPNYAVLVDVRYRTSPQITYVVQENIEVIKEKIQHPKIDNYFAHYDGAQYIPSPWLRAIYQLD